MLPVCAPLARAEGAAEGADILNESERPTGNILGAALQDVMLWIGATPGRQGTAAARAPASEHFGSRSRLADRLARGDTT